MIFFFYKIWQKQNVLTSVNNLVSLLKVKSKLPLINLQKEETKCLLKMY